MEAKKSADEEERAPQRSLAQEPEKVDHELAARERVRAAVSLL